MFSAHHGLVHIHRLPAPHTLVAPSDRFSALRGLTSSGENNLAFKCMRKRVVFETLHLDVEGGVGERRTTAPRAAPRAEAGDATARVSVEHVQSIDLDLEGPPRHKASAKKKVAFHSDRPDVYDF